MSEPDLLQELRIDPEAREVGRKSWPRLLAVGLLVAGLAAGAWFLIPKQPLVVEGAVATAPEGKAATVLDATGYVVARRQATVSSKISGKLAEVLIEEGERVKAGQVLARLEDIDAKAQLGLAEAKLAAAQSQLQQTRVELEQAKRDLGRQRGLDARKLTSKEQLDQARTQVQSLSAKLDAQSSQVQVSEAELDLAKVGYDNTIVRAPFDGVVVTKAAQPGEIVSPMSAGGGFTRTGIGTIVDMDSLEIEVDVNESFINRVQPGQAVEAVLDAYPDWKIPASVIAIIPTADRSKATVKVRIAIDQKDPRQLPEMGVRVSFLKALSDAETSVAGVLVPAGAIKSRDAHDLVFVLDGDIARERKVTAGETLGDRRLVTQGLSAGERLVRDPPEDLADGTRVQLRSDL